MQPGGRLVQRVQHHDLRAHLARLELLAENVHGADFDDSALAAGPGASFGLGQLDGLHEPVAEVVEVDDRGPVHQVLSHQEVFFFEPHLYQSPLHTRLVKRRKSESL